MFINDILQPTHLLFILVVALLVLGPKRLPEAGRALGKGIRDFRSAIGGEEDHHSSIPSEPTVAPMAATPAPVIPASEPPLVHPRPTETATPATEPAETGATAETGVAAETGAAAETAHPVS